MHSHISSTPANYSWRACSAPCQYYPEEPILSAQLISWKPEQACGLSCDNTHLGCGAIADWRPASVLFLYYLMLISSKSLDSVFEMAWTWLLTRRFFISVVKVKPTPTPEEMNKSLKALKSLSFLLQGRPHKETVFKFSKCLFSSEHLSVCSFFNLFSSPALLAGLIYATGECF